MNKSDHKSPNLNAIMQEDLIKLAIFSNDYGPQNAQEAIEATQAALKDLLFGISRNIPAETEEGQFNLALIIQEPSQFFGAGEKAGELINLQSLKPETIALIVKSVLMQLNASDENHK